MSKFDKNELKKFLLDYTKYMDDWGERYKIYEITKKEEIFIDEMWCVLLINTNISLIVTDVTDMSYINNLKEISKIEFFKEIEKFYDDDYLIYYKQYEQHLVGYLLDFFIYYAKLPEKIKTVEDDNINFIQMVKNQKLKIKNYLYEWI